MRQGTGVGFMKAYEGPYSKVNGAYGGIDDLGRALTTDASLPLPRENRSVGIFYYLAPGNHGLRGPYDNSKIVAAHPDATDSEEAWTAARGMRIIIGENLCSAIIRCMTNGLSGSIFRC